MMKKRFALWVAVVLAFPGAASAFDVLPADTFYNPITAQNSAWASLNYANTLAGLPPIGAGSPASPRVAKVPAPRKQAAATIEKLVAPYPRARRPLARRTFTELYAGYGKIERYYGIPRHDLAGAIAAFLVANYGSYRDLDVSDDDYKAVVTQTRRVLESSRGFARMKPGAKRSLYEQMAILGTFVGATRLALQDRPNAATSAKLKSASQRYLEKLLKVDADRVQLTSEGLIITP